MKDFIRLHNSDDNGLIIVNTDTIAIVFATVDAKGRTLSKMILKNYANISPFTVNETPEMIITKDNDKFIVLHDADMNRVIICRKDNISVIDTIKTNAKSLKSRVYFDSECDAKPIMVHESAEKIMQSLDPIIESK